MVNNKISVKICLGSSCFARGNKKTIRIIEKYIKDNHIESKVHFHGAHCFGKCDKGPVLQIHDKFYEQLDESGIHEILAKELGPLTGK